MLNWVKIRVWEQVQWDGIIMIDVDVTVLGDLTHLFKLPTDFAAVPDNGKVWNRYIRTICTSPSTKRGIGPAANVYQARPSQSFCCSSFHCMFAPSMPFYS